MRILQAFLFCVLCISCTVKSANFLVEKGQSDFVIVISDTAIEAEKTAANELQSHLKQITNADLKIIKASEYQSGPMIAVGFNSKLPAELSAKKYGKLADEELIIDSDGENLLLAGGSPRGSLYAVYEYLNGLGVRWYTPEYTKIPELKTIELPAKIIRYNPPVVMRSYLQNNRPTSQWTARNRMNQFIVWGDPGKEFGGGYSQGPDMHTCWRLLPADLMKAHPEWCAEVDGKRELPAGTNHWGICYSNEALQNIIIEKTLDYARKNPDKKVIWFGQNDGSPPCECEKCKAFTDAHGGKPSALVVRLVNKIADAMAKEMPDRMVKTLAYSWSQDAPTGMKLRDNVIIMYCAPGDYYTPIAIDKKEAATAARKRAKDWVAIAKNIEVYLYEFPTDCYWFPTPNLYTTAKNIEWAFNAGISHIYMQICGCATGDGAELVDLRAWIYAQKLWNPDLDERELVKEFCRDYYGPAADVVLKAISLTNDGEIYDKDGEFLKRNNSVVARSFLDPKEIRQINRMLEKAHDSMSDEVYKKRLRYVWIPYLWADVWIGFTGPGKYNAANGTWSVIKDGKLSSRYGRLCKQFMIEAGVSALKENRRLNPHTLMIDLMGTAFKANRLTDNQLSVVAVPELAGQIFEFTDKRLKFSPLAPYNEHLVWEYPLNGPWRDYVNGCFVRSFWLKDRKADKIVFAGKVGDFNCEKTIVLSDQTLTSVFSATACKDGNVSVYPSPMLNMKAEVFGDYPTMWIEKTDGSWSSVVLGEGISMHYYIGSLDIKNATGRMILASETRSEGLELRFSPEEVDSFRFEYDRYFHMLHLWPTSPNKMLKAGESAQVSLSMKIVADAKSLVE